MVSFLDALRARRPEIPSGEIPSGRERRTLWARARLLLGSVWNPRQRTDLALPNWVHVLVGLSDDGLRIPGTSVRLGLDAVLGTLLPGAGDALGGVTSVTLMYVAWRRGASRDLLLRMLGNATLDIAFGTIPVVGDLFDLGFHANRRNLSLLEEFLRQRSQAERVSRFGAVLIFGLLFAVVLLAIAAMIGLVVVSWRELRE
jgi:hypothetical protein